MNVILNYMRLTRIDENIHNTISNKNKNRENDIEKLIPLMETARKQGHNLNTTTKHYLKKGLKKL